MLRSLIKIFSCAHCQWKICLGCWQSFSQSTTYMSSWLFASRFFSFWHLLKFCANNVYCTFLLHFTAPIRNDQLRSFIVFNFISNIYTRNTPTYNDVSKSFFSFWRLYLFIVYWNWLACLKLREDEHFIWISVETKAENVVQYYRSWHAQKPADVQLLKHIYMPTSKV